MKTSHLLKNLLNLRFAGILEWYFIALGNSTEASALPLFLFLCFDQVRVQKEENIGGSAILLLVWFCPITQIFEFLYILVMCKVLNSFFADLKWDRRTKNQSGHSEAEVTTFCEFYREWNLQYNILHCCCCSIWKPHSQLGRYIMLNEVNILF